MSRPRRRDGERHPDGGRGLGTFAESRLFWIKMVSFMLSSLTAPLWWRWAPCEERGRGWRRVVLASGVSCRYGE